MSSENNLASALSNLNLSPAPPCTTATSNSTAELHADRPVLTADHLRRRSDAGDTSEKPGSSGKPNRDRSAERADFVIGGNKEVLEALRELIVWPLLYSEEAHHLGVSWPRGLLLHGPPGCGKTSCVQAVAQEAGVPLHVITSANIVGAYVGESERRLRDAFMAADKAAAGAGLCVVFIDEMDTLCSKRGGGADHEARLVGQLLTLMDATATQGGGGRVVVVGATNRPNAIDAALRRPGRLDREVSVNMPNEQDRSSILGIHTSGMPLAPAVSLSRLSSLCSGYTGADICAWVREAAMHAISRNASTGTTGEGMVELQDFEAALSLVGPSVARGYMVEVPKVDWSEIGGLHYVKKRLQQAVEWPLKHPEAFSRLGLSPPRGVMLHGPPGCSKTSLARAVCSCSGAVLIPLTAASLYSCYVGEGEAMLRDTFRKARLAAPSIIFIDEIDALAGKRSEGSGGVDGVGVRLLSALLTEMDGLESIAGSVLILAATNRIAAVDAALLRPGRFDIIQYVPPPDELGRLEILELQCRNIPLAQDVDLKEIARKTTYFTAAEICNICREAALAALREDLQNAQQVAARHFSSVLSSMQPYLNASTLAAYEQWDKQLRARGAAS